MSCQHCRKVRRDRWGAGNSILSDLERRRSLDTCLALIYSNDSNAYYLDGVPVFAGEGILRSLLKAFLAFRKAFVPALESVIKQRL